jgi:hypothetical protein
MSKDNPIIVQTRLNLDLLCDTQTLLTMSCVLPLSEAINALIKFVQRRHVFICDFVVVVQICQVNFFMMLFDPMINYQSKHFQILWCCRQQFWHHHPRLGYWPKHCVKIVAFHIVSRSYQAHVFIGIVGVNQLVCKDVS